MQPESAETERLIAEWQARQRHKNLPESREVRNSQRHSSHREDAHFRRSRKIQIHSISTYFPLVYYTHFHPILLSEQHLFFILGTRAMSINVEREFRRRNALRAISIGRTHMLARVAKRKRERGAKMAKIFLLFLACQTYRRLT